MSRRKKKSAHIKALAKFRGTSYAEAAEWFRQELLVEQTEATMLGKMAPELADNQSPMFGAAAAPPRAREEDLECLNEFGQKLLDRNAGDIKFRERPKLEGLSGDALIEATEVVMTHEGLYPAEAVEAANTIGEAMAKAFMEEMNRPSKTRQILKVTPIDPSRIGKGTIIAENGVLLSHPRPTTPEEDLEHLVDATERKMLGVDSALQESLNQAAGIPKGTPTRQVFLAPPLRTKDK